MMSTFDTTPNPAFLHAMQSQKWTVSGALAELVDNGFGLGRGNARRVQIIHDTRQRILTVLDNGRGMDAIGRLFQLGNTIGRTPGDIGEYGSGGTMALLWLARQVEIWTCRAGMVSHDRVDWNESIRDGRFPRVSNDWRKITWRNVPPELSDIGHGTLIRLHLQQGRKVQAANVRQHLAAIYAPAIRQQRELVWTTIGKNGITQTLADLLIEPTDEDRLVRFDIPITSPDGVDLSITGIVGIIDDLPISRSQVSIAYGHRVLIKTRDCYTSPDGSRSYAGTGVAGWLDLGEGWRRYMATLKDDIHDSEAWDLLMAKVFAEIEPILAQVEDNEYQLELDNLALNLEDAFGGLSKVKFAKDEFDGEIEPSETAGNQKARKPSKDATPDDQGEEEPGGPTATQIMIYRRSDADLEGDLCRAELSRSGATVFINADHPVIQAALKSNPANRLALNMAITRELADEIVGKPEIARHILPKPVLVAVEDADRAHGTRMVHRLMMDSIRNAA